MIKKNKKKKAFLVPWCGENVPWCVRKHEKQVSMYHWKKGGGSYTYKDIDWRKNDPFKASFKVKHFTGSTSSTQIVMINTANDELFLMRDTDFIAALSQSACVFGVFIGNGNFAKQVADITVWFSSGRCYNQLSFDGYTTVRGYSNSGTKIWRSPDAEVQ